MSEITKKIDQWEEALIYASKCNNWGVIRPERMQRVNELKQEVLAAVRNLEMCARINVSN